MVTGLFSPTVFLASNSCQKLDFGRVQVVSQDWPLEVEVRHVELKYVAFFVCSNSDESEDEEHNQTMTHAQKSSGSSMTRHHADRSFRVTVRWTQALYDKEVSLKKFKVDWAKNTAALQFKK